MVVAVEELGIVCCAALVVSDCIGGESGGDSGDRRAGVWLLVVGDGVWVALVDEPSCATVGVVIVGRVIRVCE